MGRFTKYFAIFALVAMVVPVAGCLFGSKSETIAATSSDNTLSFAIANLTSPSLAPNGAPQKAITNLRRSDITVYKTVGSNATATTVDSKDMVWDTTTTPPVLKVLNAGTATYTVDLANVARFSVPAKSGYETAAKVTVPSTIDWTVTNNVVAGSADANSYVTCAVEVAEMMKSSTASTTGTKINFYKYYNQSQVGSNGLFSGFTPATMSFYKWSDVDSSTTASKAQELTAAITKTDGTAATALGVGSTDPSTLLTSTKMGTSDFQAITNKTTYDAAMADTSSLLYTHRTAFFSLASIVTGQTVSTSDDVLTKLETTSKTVLNVKDIVIVKSTGLTGATTTTTSDSTLDYGDDAYFVIITNDHNDSSVSLNVSATIASYTDAPTTRQVKFGSYYRVNVPVVTGQTNVWGSTSLYVPMMPQNMSNGVMDITFTITDRGAVKQIRKTYKPATTTTPTAPSISVIATSSEPGSTNPTTEVTFPVAAVSTTPLYLSMITNITSGYLYLDIKNAIDYAGGSTEGENILPTTTPSGWSKVTDPTSDVYGMYEIALTRFGSSWSTEVTQSATAWGVYFKKASTTNYVVKIVAPTTVATAKYGTFNMTARMKNSSTGAYSSLTSKTLEFKNAGWTSGNSVNPNFDLGWEFHDASTALTSSSSLTAYTDITLAATDEAKTFHVYMKPETFTAATTAGTVDTSHMVYHIWAYKDGVQSVNGFYRSQDSATVASTTCAITTATVTADNYLFGNSSTLYFDNSGSKWHVYNTGIKASSAGVYRLRVQAVAPNGKVYDSGEKVITVTAPTSPALSIGANTKVDASNRYGVVLQFNMELDSTVGTTASVYGQFSVKIGTTAQTISAMSYGTKNAYGTPVTLTIGTAVTPTDTVTVTYTKSSTTTNNLKSIGGRYVDSFTDQSVTNSTEITVTTSADLITYAAATPTAGSNDLIKLGGNITLAAALTISDADVVLDLNTYTLTDATGAALAISGAATVKNGTINVTTNNLAVTQAAKLTSVTVSAGSVSFATAAPTLTSCIFNGAVESKIAITADDCQFKSTWATTTGAQNITVNTGKTLTLTGNITTTTKPTFLGGGTVTAASGATPTFSGAVDVQAITMTNLKFAGAVTNATAATTFSGCTFVDALTSAVAGCTYTACKFEPTGAQAVAINEAATFAGATTFLADGTATTVTVAGNKLLTVSGTINPSTGTTADSFIIKSSNVAQSQTLTMTGTGTSTYVTISNASTAAANNFQWAVNESHTIGYFKYLIAGAGNNVQLTVATGKTLTSANGTNGANVTTVSGTVSGTL